MRTREDGRKDQRVDAAWRVREGQRVTDPIARIDAEAQQKIVRVELESCVGETANLCRAQELPRFNRSQFAGRTETRSRPKAELRRDGCHLDEHRLDGFLNATRRGVVRAARLEAE